MRRVGLELYERLPEQLKQAVAATIQSPKWHPEGSVLNHINLVSDQLPNDLTLQAAAIFHDLGKTVTTKAIEKDIGISIQSIGHEQASVRILRDLQMSGIYDVYPIQWDAVTAIVADHMLMHKYTAGELRQAKREKLQQSDFFDLKVQFTAADEAGIGSAEDTMPLVLITIGIPGSGKSRWATQFCTQSGYTYICPDSIRKELTGSISDQSKNGEVWMEAYNRLIRAILAKQSVVFDSTACNVATIKQLEFHCKTWKAIPVYKLFSATPELAKTRITADIVAGVDRSAVPSGIIDRMYHTYTTAVLPYVVASTMLQVVQKHDTRHIM